MATSRKSVSAKQPEGETKPKKEWLSILAIVVPIIVAIIGGIFAISKVYIGRTAPEPKSVEPTKIEQQTHGSGSPAIGHTGGNVTIQQDGGGEKR